MLEHLASFSHEYVAAPALATKESYWYMPSYEIADNYPTTVDLEYKAISLWQPWASLIPLGLKHYETRGWKTSYRGKLLICATAAKSKQHKEYLKIKDELRLPPWDTFTHGYAIALVDLVDCIHMSAEFIAEQSRTEILGGDWQVGRYAWKLENIQPLAKPFAVKGKQGFFSIKATNQQLLLKEELTCNNPSDTCIYNIPESQSSFPKTSDLWYTPENITELIVKALVKIDLDPCADDGKHIPATLHYTQKDDGLSKEWYGRVFINPPYSCPGKWMKKLQAEFEAGRVVEAIALVPAATDTSWLAPVLSIQPVCFWKGRIKFLDVNYQPKQSARQSHVLVYWGDNWKRFKEVFEEYGFVSVPGQFLEDYSHNQQSRRKTTDSINVEKVYLDIESVSSDITDKSKFLEESFLSSRKSRRNRGEGSGCIYYRTVIKRGKEYREAYYQYELWTDGDAVIKTTKYIPKKLLSRIQECEAQKTPVREILSLLGVKL
jgi:phage N-6-adenine-methyltransferase